MGAVVSAETAALDLPGDGTSKTGVVNVQRTSGTQDL